jgi:hypothetical protein
MLKWWSRQIKMDMKYSEATNDEREKAKPLRQMLVCIGGSRMGAVEA